ncbi:MAG: 6-hydroxymethylpterin diphosphokinase MptE-like protein [Spirochaetales bacterium]
MEELLISRKGLPTARYRGNLLHSLYDPEKEADQYLKTQYVLIKSSPILIIGSCLGYLEALLQKNEPHIKILSLQLSSFFRGKTQHTLPENQCWYPDSSIPLKDFLLHTIEDPELSSLRILLWNPGIQAYEGTGQEVVNQVIQFLRERTRSVQTLVAFGKKWILNALKNFLFHPLNWKLKHHPYPICIAASGPSLKSSLPFLAKYRDRFVLWALPSSLQALVEASIIPDLILLTDGGFYASRLIHPILRINNLINTPIPLLTPLTGAFLPPHPALTPVFFHQGLEIEKLLLSNLSIPLEYYPPNGTVSGSAVEIALRITSGPIGVCGLDLCTTSSTDHVRPHPFETLLDLQQNRRAGTETPWISRLWNLYPDHASRNCRTNPALKTYAGWFQQSKDRWFSRVFRLYPSQISTGMKPIPPEFLATLSPISPVSLLQESGGLSGKDKKEALQKICNAIREEKPLLDKTTDLLFRTSLLKDPGFLYTLARLEKQIGGDFCNP